MFPISITRFAALEASKELKKINFKVSVFNLFRIKPLYISNAAINNLKKVKYFGLVSDDDYVNGISKCIAHDLTLETSKKVLTIGLEEKTAGFSKKTDNLSPTSEKIRDYLLSNRTQ